MSKDSPIYISLSPNTERDDILIAAQTLLKPHHWRQQLQLKPDIEKKLSLLLDGQSIVLTTSGRGALYEALRAERIGQGDEVIIQAFTCLAVPAAVKWTGATPIYADINPDTYNFNAVTVERHITHRTKAIIIQHTFGIPAPLEELIALARQHNILVIEDMAHSMGGQYKGRPLGSYGDIAVLSFGRDKTISCVFGGAVATRHQRIYDTIFRNVSAYPPAPKWWVIQQLLHPLIVNMVAPIYFVGPFGRIILVMSQRLHLLSLAVSPTEKTSGARPAFVQYSFPVALLPLLENQLDKLTRFTARRRQIAMQYLTRFPASVYLNAVAAEANWLRFPVVVPDKRQAVKAARQLKMLLGDWYATPVSPCSLAQQEVTGYLPGSCPQAEQAAKHTLNLPTHPRLKSQDVERIIHFMENND